MDMIHNATPTQAVVAVAGTFGAGVAAENIFGLVNKGQGAVKSFVEKVTPERKSNDASNALSERIAAALEKAGG